MLDGDAGDEAVYGGADGYARATAVEVHAGGLLVAFDRVTRLVEGLGSKVFGDPIKLPFRGDALGDFLKYDARKPYGNAQIQHLGHTPRDFGLPSCQVIDPDAGIHQVQDYFPSRNAL